MKQITLSVFFLFSILCLGQNSSYSSGKKNELRLNALLLTLSPIEISYERILNEDSGAGATVHYAKDDNFTNVNFSITPYYKAYLGEKECSGLFVEVFGMLNSGKSPATTTTNPITKISSEERKPFTDFALGFGGGSKWVHSKGLVLEAYLGAGRNLFKTNENNSPSFVVQGGLNLGFRF